MSLQYNRKQSRSTSVSPPGRGLNHYAHVELDEIHARLVRGGVFSSRHKAVANHGLQVDKIDLAISLISQSAHFMAGRSGEHTAQSAQFASGRPDECITELNLELKSLLQTFTLAKLANSANIRFVSLDSTLTETVNAEIHECCAALPEFLDGIQKQPSLRSNVWGWWSRASGWNGSDESKLADFRANWSDTRKSLRKFMLTLTETLDSRHSAPINSDNRQENEHGVLGQMFITTSSPHGQSNDEGRNLEINRVQDHTTHSMMFQDSNNSNISGARISSAGHDMLVEHNHARMNRSVLNLVVHGTANVSYLNPQYGATPRLSHDEIPAESLVDS